MRSPFTIFAHINQPITPIMPKYKYYVVWEGRARGIFNSWEECKEQVENFKGAKYKSFDSLEAATEAYRNAPDDYFDVMRKIGELSREKLSPPPLPSEVIANSLSVDAACSGNPGKMEYRGVDTQSGIELFHVGPLEQGTNNIGEFLALVHGLAYLQQRGSTIPIYSDSRNAILWIQQKKCKTKLLPNAANAPIFDLIARAERWLQTHSYPNRIIKWNTEKWGEIPADFGRK